MDPEHIALIRKHFDVPDGMTNDEINGFESYLGDTYYLHLSSYIRVGNFIELMGLRRSHYPSRPEPFSDPFGENVFWLFCCESLFVEGHYGPCCVWARATAEYILYELCLSNPVVPNEFKEEILRRGENPGIELCLKKLQESRSISREASSDCRTIAQNGDYVVHHRLPEILRGRGMKRLLTELGVEKKNLGKEGFKKHDEARDGVIRKALRPTYERRMAKESMKLLYRFISEVTADVDRNLHSRPAGYGS